MSDIVERLRIKQRLGTWPAVPRELAVEAADEIERLRAEIEQLRAINKDVGIALDIAAGQAKPDLRALLPELAVIRQVMKDTKP